MDGDLLDAIKIMNENGLILPDYRDSNLNSIKEFSSDKEKNISQKRVLIVLDALGSDLLNRVLEKNAGLKTAVGKMEIKTTKTIFPSLTPVVLTSFDSGMTVSEHAVVGDSMPVKEFNTIVNTMAYAPASDPSSKLDETKMSYVFQEPKLINDLAKNNKTVVLIPENLKRSAYCSATFSKQTIIPYIYFEDMIAKVGKIMKEGSYEFIYAYVEAIDKLLHAYSPDSYEAEILVQSLISLISNNIFPIAKETGYKALITSDHGHMTLKSEDIIAVESNDKISEFLTMPPWGSYRYYFLDVIEGKEDKFEQFFEATYGKKALLFKSDDLIKSGIFGGTNVKKGFEYRFGNYTMIGIGRNFFYYLYPGKKKWWANSSYSQSGVHGGMSEAEMYVPVIRF